MDNLGEIGFTEEQIDMLTVAESFCREKSPIERVRSLMETESGYDAEVWAEIGALGWLSVAIPEGYGGAGLSLTEVVPLAEQLGRYMLASPFLSTTLAGQAIVMGGAEAQKTDILPQIATGTAATLALSEPNGDWDLTRITATATLTKIGAKAGAKTGYTLSGTKTFVMDLEAAHWVVISALTEGKPALFILPKDQIPPASIRCEGLIDETKRGYELTLDGITIDADARMDADKTAETLAYIHLVANLLGAAELTGGCQSVIDYTVAYLNTRKQFGKLIGSFQALKHPTVDAFVDYQKARSLLYTAAFSFARQGEGEIATRMAKAQASQAMSFAADRSIQFHGGFGFTYDCDAQLYRRRAIFHSSQYGDAAFHKAKLAQILL